MKPNNLNLKLLKQMERKRGEAGGSLDHEPHPFAVE